MTNLKSYILLDLLFLLFALSGMAETQPPRDSIPEDHLAWLGLRGPVAEVREYDYGSYTKTFLRFDRHGRLTEYMDYMNPFAGDGGCVFGVYNHFRYDYDENGKIIFLETYNADNTLVDDFDGMILELFPQQNKEADFFAQAEPEFGDTTFCWSQWTQAGERTHYRAKRFDSYGNWIEDVDADVDDYSCARVRVRDIRYYPPVIDDPRLTSLERLPEGCSKETAFGLIFKFKGYVFEGSLYPLHDGRWIVLSYWCLDEMDGIYAGEDENGEPIPAASQYKNPFLGIKYPVIKTDSVSFSTRNYSNQTIKLYKHSKGHIVWDKLRVQCSLDVLDADPKTRRVLCRTNPEDWMWGEPQNEEEKEYKHPYVSVYGWMDEEWICANLMTTCP